MEDHLAVKKTPAFLEDQRSTDKDATGSGREGARKLEDHTL